MQHSEVKDTALNRSFAYQSNVGYNNTSLNRSFISTAPNNELGNDLTQSRIKDLPNYKKTNLFQTKDMVVVFQTIEIQRLSGQVEFLRVRLKQYQRQIFNAQNYEVQIRELTEKCFSLEREREEYMNQSTKLNKICEGLYHENQMYKERLSEMDISLKQKLQSEKAKNLDLQSQIEQWKRRYQSAEKSKTKELEDLRSLMENQRKSMVDREIKEMQIRFANERSNLQNQIRKAREALENKNRDIQDYKDRCQKYEITVMELRNNENIINDYESKMALAQKELMRLNDVLRDKAAQMDQARKNEHNLQNKLKDQQDWEYQNKQLKSNLDNRSREIEQWKIRHSRVEDDLSRYKELEIYNSELKNKLKLASDELERLNNLLRGKMEEIEKWKKKYNDKDLELAKYRTLENEQANYQSKISNLQIENDRINGILKTRLSEIEEWKRRYHQLESDVDHYKSFEKDKKMLEHRYNEQVKNNEEMNFKANKLQNEITNYKKYENQFMDSERQNALLNKQVDRLNGLLKSRANELDDFKTKFSKVESSMKEYRNAQGKARDYENKVGLMNEEISRLNDLINHKNREIEALEGEKLDMHTKITHLKSYEQRNSENDAQARKLNDQLQDAKRSIQEWQSKYREIDSKNRDLDSQLFKSTQDKEKLSNMMKLKNIEFDEVRTKASNLELEARKAQQYQQAVNQLQSQVGAASSDMQAYARQIDQLTQSLQTEKQFSNEFACKVIVLSSEIERLTQRGGISSKESKEMQDEYSKTVTKLKSKNNEVESLHHKITTLESKVGQLTNEYQRLLREAQKSLDETAALQRKIEEYQDYAKRIHILGAQIDRLKVENKSLDEDARKMRLKYANNIENEKKEEALAMQLVLMAAEMENLRGKISEREMSEEEMRKSILEPVRRI